MSAIASSTAQPSHSAPELSSVSVGLTERETTVEASSVRVQNLRLGNQTHNFVFSLTLEGHEAPIEREKLAQLALGCKRSLELTYTKKVQQHRNLCDKRDNEDCDFTKTDERLLAQVTKELSALDHIKAFNFAVKGKTPVIRVEGICPHSHEIIKVDIVLDSHFSGLCDVYSKINRQLESQIEDITIDLGILEDDLETDADTESIRPQIDELRRQLAILRLQQEHLYKDENLSVTIVKERPQGAQGFIHVPKIVLKIPRDGDEFDKIEFEDPYLKTLVLHYSGKVQTNGHLVNDIVQVAKKATESKTDEGKAFAEKVEKSRKERQKEEGASSLGQVNNTGSANHELMRQEAMRRHLAMQRAH